MQKISKALTDGDLAKLKGKKIFFITGDVADTENIKWFTLMASYLLISNGVRRRLPGLWNESAFVNLVKTVIQT